MSDPNEENEDDPLDSLPESEAQVMKAVLMLIDASISDEDLREHLIGGILVEIEDWARTQPKVQ